MIKAILFDYYGVFRPDTYDRWLAENGYSRTADFAQVADAADTHVITHEQFIDRLSQLSGHDRQAVSDYFSADHGFEERFRSLLSSLKVNYKIGIISNGSTNTRQRLEQDGIIDVFDSIIISAEVGAAKPDPAIYHTAIQALHVAPEEIVYIDDKAVNIQAGRRLGMYVIHFTDFDMLQTSLHTALHGH